MSLKDRKKVIYIQGQSLFEVIVAIGVTALILVGAMSLSTLSVRNSSFARNDAIATKYAQEGIEYLRHQRDTDWEAFRTGFTNKSCLGNSFSTSSCNIDGVYNRSLDFTCERYDPGPPVVGPVSVGCGDSRANIINTNVTVSWDDAQGTHLVKTDTTFTRWR